MDYAQLNIVSDVCLTIQAPVAQLCRRWSRKPEISGSIPRWAHFLHVMKTWMASAKSYMASLRRLSGA